MKHTRPSGLPCVPPTTTQQLALPPPNTQPHLPWEVGAGRPRVLYSTSAIWAALLRLNCRPATSAACIR
jgi:hypothetical protein